MQVKYYTTKQRLLAFSIVAAFVFFALFSRLFFIQVVNGRQMQIKATEQWTRSLPINPLRGDIVDTNGVVLATSITSYSVYIRARSVTDAAYVAQVLSDKLEMPYDSVYAKASNKGVSEVTVKRQISKETANAIMEHNLQGVYLAQDSSRQYNYGDFLTQVLGYTSIDNVGQTGIEAYYDKYLKGIQGSILTQTDLVGIEQSDKSIVYTPGVDGMQVVLTIDSVIQQITERVIETAYFAHNPQAVRAVVLDVTDGSVLAMANYPSFDLNSPPRDDLEKLNEYSRNALLTDIYEPGSTFKVLTAAASLEEASKGNKNAFDANYIFRNNANYRVVDGRKVNCWTNHNAGKHNNQNLSMALNNSCNPIFTDIALSLGKETFYNYLEKFGYGKISGIDFLGEQAGMLLSKNLVKNGDLARIGFGQTIAVTPMQLANATAAAVNGGILFQPRLVKEIRDNTGKKVVSFPAKQLSRPISSATSANVSTMLRDVVTLGSGKQAYIPGYEVGGKTGTAQKYENGIIAEGKYVSSFVGFFPASSPKYLVLFIVDEPVGAHYGSTVAAPYAKLIFEQIINYKNIPSIT